MNWDSYFRTPRNAELSSGRMELMGFSESCRNFRTSVPDSAGEKEHDYHESFMDLGVGGEDQ